MMREAGAKGPPAPGQCADPSFRAQAAYLAPLSLPAHLKKGCGKNGRRPRWSA